MENQIAQTIFEQINALDPNALGAYGCVNTDNNTIKTIGLKEDGNCRGGIALAVDGFNVQGWAVIRLMGNDTYTIGFLEKNGKLIKEVENVYSDQLVDILDFIEKGLPTDPAKIIQLGENGTIIFDINLN